MDTDPLRELLRRVHQRLGDRVLLSRVGIALREIDPAFNPESYSALSLTDLLRRVPDVGAIVGEGSQKMFVFKGAGPEPGRPVRLQHPLWRAVTDFGGGWFMDLSTFRLRNASRDPEHLLQSESERFVAVPALGVEFQKQLARGFAHEHLPERAGEVENALSGEDWAAVLSSILDAAGLADRWHAYRSSRIIEETLKWADQHGIAQEHVVEPAATARPRAMASTSSGGDLADMRALMHDAIDMMSLPELATLNVPPAYLILAGSRRRR